MANESPIDEKVVDDRGPVIYDSDIPLEHLQKSRWERSWPTIACGAGLFSDGYIQGYSSNILVPQYLMMMCVGL